MKTPATAPSPGNPPATRAAAYVRMSTEHQQYSTSNQMDVIREYATRRNMEIVTIYSDEGKSGLNIQGRESLARMIADVQSKRADYKCILVYDITVRRPGRKRRLRNWSFSGFMAAPAFRSGGGLWPMVTETRSRRPRCPRERSRAGSIGSLDRV